MTTTDTTDLDTAFDARLASGIAAVQAWESTDAELRTTCRALLPWDDLRRPGLTDDDEVAVASSPSLLLLQRLTRSFPKSMTWINEPPCNHCSRQAVSSATAKTKMEYVETRQAETPEELDGRASRVEVFRCETCHNNTSFPRYNAVHKLFQTRSGRCGEYANLFGFILRCVGFDTRYILDVTDHVWVEAYIPEWEEWIMADPCEGLIHRSALYEAGWGKQLSYVLAFGIDHVIDVTPRYTRQWFDADFQARRRSITSSEEAAENLIQLRNQQRQKQQYGAGVASHLQQRQPTELQRRLLQELMQLQRWQQTTEWTPEEKKGQGGRISGSWEWKLKRSELGGSNPMPNANNEDNKPAVALAEATTATTNSTRSSFRFHVESFYPPINDNTVSIAVQASANGGSTSPHAGIVVAGAKCAMGVKSLQSAIAVVVVDEYYVGCILQSRSFELWSDVAQFVQKLPSQRIVVLVGKLPPNGQEAPPTSQDNGQKEMIRNQHLLQTRLGGFQPELIQPGILYVGQVDAHPSWAVCASWPQQQQQAALTANTAPANDCVWTEVALKLSAIPSSPPSPSLPACQLRTERSTQPRAVAGRLPDSIMPYDTQVVATEAEKHKAFLKWYAAHPHFDNNNTTNTKRYCGYTTKANAPIYLIDCSAYPFRRMYSSTTKYDAESWITCHFLPPALVPANEDSNLISIASSVTAAGPSFDVPIESSFFIDTLGSTLLSNSSIINNPGPATTASNHRLPTLEALHNARLIGLYFSAHWCGPCRSFTPVLTEFYLRLQKLTSHQHGLQIIFFSSDRDPGSFLHYFDTMPWLAVPFDDRVRIPNRYGVTSFPALVILDAVSGQVVSSASQSRSEVMQACQHRGGDAGIEELWKNWLMRVPPETTEILSMLELSCLATDEQNDSAEAEQEANDSLYLVRDVSTSAPPGSPDSAVATGMPVNATERIKQLFAEFVKGGLEPNAAAAQAIEKVAQEQKQLSKPTPATSTTSFSKGALNEYGTLRLDVAETLHDKLLQRSASNLVTWNGKAATLETVLTTAKKYVENVRKEPWTPKFRTFKLSNKVADHITGIDGGLDLLQALGLDVFGTSQDFWVRVPLAADLEALLADMDALLPSTA